MFFLSLFELWKFASKWKIHLTQKLTLMSMTFSSVQFSSVAQSCPTLCDPMNRRTPGLLVHHQLPEFTQTHVHRVGDAIQSSHPLSSPSPAPSLSQHQSLFQWVNSSHEVAKVLVQRNNSSYMLLRNMKLTKKVCSLKWPCQGREKSEAN